MQSVTVVTQKGLGVPVCHSARNLRSVKSGLYKLHAEPARVRSAVTLLSPRTTLLALYPGQSSARLRGTAFPQRRKLVPSSNRLCKNVVVKAGMAEIAVKDPLL